MATDYESATDTILSVLRLQWNADTPALVGTVAPCLLVYEETERDLKPHPLDGAQPWARVAIRHSVSAAAALGNKRFRRTGSVYLQVFTPNKDGLAKGLSAALARVVQKAYESTRGTAVSFKNVSVEEKGVDGSFFRTDCTASFWWDEIR